MKKFPLKELDSTLITRKYWPNLHKLINQPHTTVYSLSSIISNPLDLINVGDIYCLTMTSTPDQVTIYHFHCNGCEHEDSCDKVSIPYPLYESLSQYLLTLNYDINIVRPTVGRPKKYTSYHKGLVRKLKNDGYSIRQIAKDLHMSTATVQKLLK